MEQYINKSALVAEIEKERSEYINSLMTEQVHTLSDILDLIDTLEVKEVDFKKEFDNYAKDILACDVQFQPFTHLYNCAKYFYELGLKAQKRE